MNSLIHPKQRSPPCIRFGLDVSKLENEDLMKMKTYRRLYNIVASDTTQSKYQFRPNLIKELYFLLQITPFIEETLQQEFLEKIQEWYDCHDHKKINLNKNLQLFMDTIRSSTFKKKKTRNDRPKSSVEWDTSVSPFLRPYTAKLKMTKNDSRPESSKGGIASTKCRTSEFKNTIMGQDQGREEAWERNQDFLKKYRTIHPEEEPTYEKLLTLMRRADKKQFDEDTALKSEDKFPMSCLRRPKTGTIKSKPMDQLLKEEGLDVIELDEDDQLQQEECFYQESDQQEIPQEENAVMEKKGLYCKDSLTQKHNEFRQKLFGLKTLNQHPEKETHPLHRLYKINFIQNQKKVIGNKENDEYLKQHLKYTKQKAAIKKQLMRKTQSKRIVVGRKGTRESAPGIQKKAKQEANKQKTISIGCKEHLPSEPIYNEKQFFSSQGQSNLNRYRKFINCLEGDAQCQFRSLNKNQRFLSEKRFNPFHQQNIDNYNDQVATEIQKVKEKMGGQYISTEKLMKGLHIGMDRDDVDWRGKDNKYTMMRKGGEKKKKKKVKRLRRGRN